MAWDPELYLRFGGERTRAAADLLARVLLTSPKRVADIGCGPGNSTALLAARYPDADIEGVDSSEEMLADARASGVRARWTQGDFNSWTPAHAPDLIYANASLQWADDPVATTLRLYRLLAPGGVIALQVPQNFDQPSHVVIHDVVESPSWKDRLSVARRYDPGAFARAADYLRALLGEGAAPDVWTSEYIHVVEGADPVFRFLSGSALRPFTALLDGETRAAFEKEVRTGLAYAYPPEPDGRTFFPFRRLFVIAARP